MRTSRTRYLFTKAPHELGIRLPRGVRLTIFDGFVTEDGHPLGYRLAKLDLRKGRSSAFASFLVQGSRTARLAEDQYARVAREEDGADVLRDFGGGLPLKGFDGFRTVSQGSDTVGGGDPIR